MHSRTWRLRTVLAGLIALAVLLGGSAALATPQTEQSPPAAVDSVGLTRADGSLTASWNAPTGASQYHITYSSDGGSSWSLAALAHTGTSITISVDNAETYLVGVRAGNDHGWSGWVNSAAAGPFVPPTPTPPAAVSSVSVTRDDGSLTASWNAPSGATRYHVTYSSDGGASWSLAALNHSSTSIDIAADNDATYIVGVRAGNDDGWSGWRNSPAAAPYVPPPARPTGLTAVAADQSVTLSWDDPADPAITGYEYSVRYAGVAWSDWTAVANGTSHTVSGLTNGTEYRFKLRAVNAGGNSKPAPAAAPWYVAATPLLPAPTGLSVDPDDHSLDISWDAVSEATSYDVRAKAQGASDWHNVAGNVTATSYTYATSETMAYVGVRARNDGGVSAWTDIGRMPPDDLLPIATGLSSGGASAQSGVSAQSVQAQSQLAAPTWGTIRRTFAGSWDIALDLNWTSVNGATAYNLLCSNYGWYWDTCGWDDDGTVTYASVPSGESQPVTVTHYRRPARGHVAPGDYTLDVRRPYTVAIRAVNGSPSQKSAWVSTLRINPLVGIPEKPTYTRTDGQITLSWKPDRWATGYDIYCDTYTPNVPHNPDYTLCATLTNVDRTDASHGVTITTWTDDGTDYAIDNTSIYDITVYSKDTWTRAGRYVPLIHPIPTLGVSAVSATGATLTVYGHTGNWWYKGKQLSGSYGSCTEVTGSSDTLSALTSNAQHRYHAYSATGCADANLIASADFKTTASGSGPAIALSNLTQTTARFTLSGHTGNWWYTNGSRAAGEGSCTAGPADFIVNLSDLTKDTSYTFKAYSASTCASAAQLAVSHYRTTPGPALTASNVADTSATITLANHSGDWWHQGTERGATQSTCTKATGAAVTVSGLTAGKLYTWGAFSASTCAKATLLDSVNFTTPALTVSNVGATTATLTIANHSDDWYYKANAAPDNTCKSPVLARAAGVKDLTGLSGATTYTYSAYSDSACTTANRLATASAFTTGVSVSNLAEANYGSGNPIAATYAQEFTTGSAAGGYTLRSVTLDFVTSATPSVTVSVREKQSNGNPDVTALATLIGTVANGETTFTCSSGCDLAASTSYFVHVSSNATGTHFIRTTQGMDQALQPTGNGWTISDEVRHFTSNAWMTYSTYVMQVGVEATFKPALTTSSVTATGATLTLSYYHDGDWYYKASTGPDQTTCRGPVSGASQTVSGLTAGTSYIYYAYSSSTCALSTIVATADAFAYPTLTASKIAATTATLTIAGHSGDWYYKADAAPDDSCQGPVSGSSTKNLTGLSANTSYTYEAYSDSACTTANKLATASAFTTLVGLTVSKIGATTATLTIAGHSDDWYYKANAAPHTDCQSAVSTSSTDLTGLSANTSYTYEAFSDSACTTANKLATASAFTTPVGLTASNVGETTATLTIAGHSTDWHYKANAAPHTDCQSAVSTSSTDLTGLSANTSYTYEAYSDSACTTANKLATAAAFTTLPGNPRNVSVANSTFSGNNRRYNVSWQKPANTEVTETFAYQVQCTSVNDKTTTSWGACGTVNVASTANTSLSQQVSHGWSSATFKYVRVRTVKDGRNSGWVIRHTQYGTP